MALLDHGARVFAIEAHVDPVADLDPIVEARDPHGVSARRADQDDADVVQAESSNPAMDGDNLRNTVRPAGIESLLRDECADGHGGADRQGEQRGDQTAPRPQPPLHRQTVAGPGTPLGNPTGTRRGSVPQTGEGGEAENGR